MINLASRNAVTKKSQKKDNLHQTKRLGPCPCPVSLRGGASVLSRQRDLNARNLEPSKKERSSFPGKKGEEKSPRKGGGNGVKFAVGAMTVARRQGDTVLRTSHVISTPEKFWWWGQQVVERGGMGKKRGRPPTGENAGETRSKSN